MRRLLRSKRHHELLSVGSVGCVDIIDGSIRLELSASDASSSMELLPRV